MVTKKTIPQETGNDSLILLESIEDCILRVRGINVLLDTDLAALYGVTTKALNQAVKRNRERFPQDFVFQLNRKEKIEVVTNCDHLSRLKYSSTLPYAFTEHGAIMAANVLKSDRAVKVSVYVVRAFVKLREALLSNKEFAGKLRELEQKAEKHDATIQYLVLTIRRLMEAPAPQTTRKIGFKPDEF